MEQTAGSAGDHLFVPEVVKKAMIEYASECDQITQKVQTMNRRVEHQIDEYLRFERDKPRGTRRSKAGTRKELKSVMEKGVRTFDDEPLGEIQHWITVHDYVFSNFYSNFWLIFGKL